MQDTHFTGTGLFGISTQDQDIVKKFTTSLMYGWFSIKAACSDGLRKYTKKSKKSVAFPMSQHNSHPFSRITMIASCSLSVSLAVSPVACYRSLAIGKIVYGETREFSVMNRISAVDIGGAIRTGGLLNCRHRSSAYPVPKSNVRLGWNCNSGLD